MTSTYLIERDSGGPFQPPYIQSMSSDTVLEAGAVGLGVSGRRSPGAAGSTFTGRMTVRSGFTNVRIVKNAPAKLSWSSPDESPELVMLLRSASRDRSPSELAQILDDHLSTGLTQSAMVFYFKQAFPETPLRVLLDAGAWSRLTDGELSTKQFDELLGQWIR